MNDAELIAEALDQSMLKTQDDLGLTDEAVAKALACLTAAAEMIFEELDAFATAFAAAMASWTWMWSDMAQWYYGDLIPDPRFLVMTGD